HRSSWRSISHHHPLHIPNPPLPEPSSETLTTDPAKVGRDDQGARPGACELLSRKKKQECGSANGAPGDD
ncbi:MAG: hypothetical protein WBW49_12955, partial [Candidatus Acidiferrum sp.]